MASNHKVGRHPPLPQFALRTCAPAIETRRLPSNSESPRTTFCAADHLLIPLATCLPRSRFVVLGGVPGSLPESAGPLGQGKLHRLPCA